MPAFQVNGKVVGKVSPIATVSGAVSPVGSVSGKVSISPGGGRSLPPGGNPGDLLTKASLDNYDAEWVTPASRVEEDNTRPITSAAVYVEIGNINALLATI